jgi:hypothetical protein
MTDGTREALIDRLLSLEAEVATVAALFPEDAHESDDARRALNRIDENLESAFRLLCYRQD